MSIATLLEELGQPAKTPPITRLQALSNLPAEEQAEFAEAWPEYSLERRREIVAWLAALAEDNVQLNFDSIFKTLLEDEDAEVRLRAIDALWECDDAKLAATFISLVDADDDTSVRAAAAAALGKFELAAEVEGRFAGLVERMDRCLIEAFEDEDQPPIVRRRALESLSTRSIPEVADAIELARQSEFQELQLGALFAMGRTYDERWLPDVLESVVDEDPEIRFEAVNALGELEAEAAVEDVIGRLDDVDAEVRLAAVNALGKIGGRIATTALKRIAASGDETLAPVAAEALAEAEMYEDPLKLE